MCISCQVDLTAYRIHIDETGSSWRKPLNKKSSEYGSKNDPSPGAIS